MPRALIVGAAGQDGSYLAELLLARGWEVHGLVLPRQVDDCPRLKSVRERVRLHAGDVSDQAAVDAAVERSAPDHVYNLASQSFMPTSWDDPVRTGDVAGLGAARLLEALRRLAPKARFYQSSSAELFGLPERAPQDERTPLAPRSPYAAAKVYAHHLVNAYRERYGLFAVSGIAFNHESPRRGPSFVTRRVTSGAAAVKLGLAKTLALGDLDARRDWGYAGDFVEAMFRTLDAEKPGDFVLATGETRSVRELAETAFAAVGLDWREHVVADASRRRPPEPVERRGDPAKARRLLGWSPRVGFRALVEGMVRWDLECLRAGRPDAVDAPAGAVSPSAPGA